MIAWTATILFALCFGGIAWYVCGGIRIKTGWQNGTSPLAKYLDERRRAASTRSCRRRSPR